jgi:hypothetical protein
VADLAAQARTQPRAGGNWPVISTDDLRARLSAMRIGLAEILAQDGAEPGQAPAVAGIDAAIEAVGLVPPSGVDS